MEHDLGVVLDVFVELYSGPRAHERDCEGGLAAHQCLAAQILAIEFNQVEGAQEHALVMPAIPDQVEQGDAELRCSSGKARIQLTLKS